MQDTPQITPRSPTSVFKDVVFALFLREAKTRLDGRWQSVFWIVFEPLAHLVILIVIFGSLRDRIVPGVDFLSWLVWGLLPFFLFRSLALRLMEAIEVNRALFVYRPVQPIDAVLSRALLEVVLAVPVYAALLFTLQWSGWPVFPARLLEVLLVGGLFVGMGVAWGLCFAVSTTGYERSRLFIRIAFFPLFILSGVMFPISALPVELQGWLLLNPIAHLLEVFRAQAVVGYQPLAAAGLLYPMAYLVLSLFVGLLIYRIRRFTILSVRG